MTSGTVILDYLSVSVFAATGALVASRKQLDIIGFFFLASLTAVGGGTVRDVLLNRYPIFWLSNPSYICVAASVALIVFFTAHLMESRYRWLIWLDSFALAVTVPAGVAAAMQMSQPALAVMFMGVITSCVGGLMRDVVCVEVPLVLREGELYVTAAFGGSLVAVVVMDITDKSLWALISCAVVTWILRAGSLHYGWRLPVYKPKPGKPRP